MCAERGLVLIYHRPVGTPILVTPTMDKTQETLKSDKPSEEPGALFKVGIRIPPFWPEEPELWFAQMESQFALSGITSDTTKFHYIVGQLDHQYAVEVKDIISSPPTENKYNKIKNALIARLTVSQDKKSLQLMKHEELGDRKPSQFLRHLRTLGGSTVTDDFLKTVWSSRLPNNIQAIIVSQKGTLNELAEIADKIHDIAPQSTQVCAMEGGGASGYVNEMAKQMAELTKEIAALKTQFNTQPREPRSQPRYSSFRKGSSPSNKSVQNQSTSRPRQFSVCWYHYRFGDKSTRCTRPCSYPGSENYDGSRK